MLLLKLPPVLLSSRILLNSLCSLFYILLFFFFWGGETFVAKVGRFLRSEIEQFSDDCRK